MLHETENLETNDMCRLSARIKLILSCSGPLTCVTAKCLDTGGETWHCSKTTRLGLYSWHSYDLTPMTICLKSYCYEVCYPGNELLKAMVEACIKQKTVAFKCCLNVSYVTLRNVFEN